MTKEERKDLFKLAKFAAKNYNDPKISYKRLVELALECDKVGFPTMPRWLLNVTREKIDKLLETTEKLEEITELERYIGIIEHAYSCGEIDLNFIDKNYKIGQYKEEIQWHKDIIRSHQLDRELGFRQNYVRNIINIIEILYYANDWLTVPEIVKAGKEFKLATSKTELIIKNLKRRIPSDEFVTGKRNNNNGKRGGLKEEYALSNKRSIINYVKEYYLKEEIPECENERLLEINQFLKYFRMLD